MNRREFLKFPKTWFDKTIHYRETIPQTTEISPIHILNRVTWGVRPEDLSLLAQMGIEGYIDYQLNYEAIPDPIIDQFINSGASYVNAEHVDLSKLHYQDWLILYTNIAWTRLFRAVYSERQLYERMVEFWTDHFHVPYGEFPLDKIIQDREAIRAKPLSTFREILYTMARSTAILFFLNNDVNDKNHPNENFARELMELYTLGEGGGYSEEDVKVVARAFTGWTAPHCGGCGFFYFNKDMHDTDEKVVLGHTIPAGGGIEDGLRVLDILSVHPSTARFISTKLCVRFVSDNPPQSLIDSTVQVFLDTEGDIRRVVRHILLSQEFAQSQGQKFRRPLEFLTAMFRVLRPGLQVLDPMIIEELEKLGHRPFTWKTPDGFPDKADLWINSSGLLHRWNLAITIADASVWWKNKINLNLEPIIPPMDNVGALVDYAATKILFAPLPPDDRAELIHALVGVNDPNIRVTPQINQKIPMLVGLIFASPYFQWH